MDASVRGCDVSFAPKLGNTSHFWLKGFLLVILSSTFELPLSEDQIAALKNGATSISIQAENPKKAGSKAWERFEKYKHATTIGEAMGKSANWQDLSGDYEKGYMKIVDVGDGIMTSSAKRSAPEGTPDREAYAIGPPSSCA